MRDDIVLEGAIPAGGIVELLSDIEATCLTGLLRYESAVEGNGAVALVRGQFAQEQTLDRHERDPVEVLLGLREGRFRLQQRLPPLPVSSGDDRVKGGSLAVHVASGLMQYCERAGLTGLLRLTRPPQAVVLHYARGELTEIRVAGDPSAEPAEQSASIDLQEVFGWEHGHFSIETRAPETPVVLSVSPTGHDLEAPSAEPPPEPSERPIRSTSPHPRESTAQHFLRVVELSLDDILKESVASTPRARTGPVIPELPAVRTERPPNAGPLKRPEPTERADSTVRVIYLAAEEAPSDEARRPAMDLNVALPGEGARRPDARNTAISAMDDAGRLRQSAWPKGNQLSDEVELTLERPRRDEDVTTEFDTASQAALDLGSLSTQLAETDAMGNDPGMSDANADSKDAPKPAPSKPNAPLKDSVAKPGLNDALVTTGWIGFALLVLTVCLAILARIPTIE